MTSFAFVTERHAIVIDGTAYPVHRNEALLCQYLMARRGQYLQAEQIAAHLGCSLRSLRVYAITVRSIINPYGLHIQSQKGGGHLGYRLVETRDGKVENCRDNTGRFTERKHSAPDQDIHSLEAQTRRAHKIFLPGWVSLQRKVAGHR